MGCNAFISCSHAADGKLAPALQTALHLFRNQTSLSASPGQSPCLKPSPTPAAAGEGKRGSGET